MKRLTDLTDFMGTDDSIDCVPIKPLAFML